MTPRKRNRILWICIILVFALSLLEINKGLFSYGVAFGDGIRTRIYSLKNIISDSIANYANQATQLENLKNIAEQKEQGDIQIAHLKAEVAQMQSLIGANIKPRGVETFLVRAYSFVNMGQYSRIWLTGEDLSAKLKSGNKVFGLIKDGYAAGIALYKDDLLLGILNGDSKVSYGVYVGDERNIGILKTDISGTVVVEYIDAWKEIKVGDEIITNGLDNIFFEGLGVGRVKKVRQEYSYIVAEVELYSQEREIGYFWLLDLESLPESQIKQLKRGRMGL